MTSDGTAIAGGCAALVLVWGLWFTFVCGLVWLLAHIVASAF